MTALLVLVLSAVAITVLFYALTTSVTEQVAGGTRGDEGLVKIEAVRVPAHVTLVVPETGEATVEPPLTLYVRNIGRTPAKVDTVYILSRTGDLILAKKLENPVRIEPGEAKPIQVVLTYHEYKLLEEKTRGGFIVKLAGARVAGAIQQLASTTSLPPLRESVESVEFNMTLVIINCGDAASWWVDIDEVLNAANNAAQKIRGLRVVEITDSSQLYTLFVERKLPDGTSVHDKRVVIVDAHGEVLPLPPQYIRDIDGDGLYEVEWCRYAKDIHDALADEPWILVTLVGAPLYYLSGNFTVEGTEVYYVFPDGTRVKMDATFVGNFSDAIVWRVDADTDIVNDEHGAGVDFQIRKGGGNPKVVVVGIRFSGAILTGDCSRNGPDWQGRMQAGHEYRLAIGGKSWHNFHPDWGGSYRLPGNTEVIEWINRFFEANLPPSVSAVRGVYVGDSWAASVVEHLYGDPNSVEKDTVMVYDDFTTDSISGLEAGEPYWSVVGGSASIDAGSHTMTVQSGTIVVRHVVGWADSNGGGDDHTLGWMVRERSVDAVTWSVQARITQGPSFLGDGYAWILLGNTTSGQWLALRLNATGNSIRGVSLARLDTLNPYSYSDNEVMVVATGLNIPSTSWFWVNVTMSFTTGTMNISIGDRVWTLSIGDVEEQLNMSIDYLKPSLGFKAYGNLVLDVKAPVKVVAGGWTVGGGYASAVFVVGKGKYIHGGYTTPNHIPKEYGYALSDVTTDFIAEAGIYYPLYLVLKELGVAG